MKNYVVSKRNQELRLKREEKRVSFATRAVMEDSIGELQKIRDRIVGRESMIGKEAVKRIVDKIWSLTGEIHRAKDSM